MEAGTLTRRHQAKIPRKSHRRAEYYVPRAWQADANPPRQGTGQVRNSLDTHRGYIQLNFNKDNKNTAAIMPLPFLCSEQYNGPTVLLIPIFTIISDI